MLSQKEAEPGLRREIAVNDIASSFIITVAGGYEVHQSYSRTNKTQSRGRARLAHELHDRTHSETDAHAVLVPGRFTGSEWVFTVLSEDLLVDRVLSGDERIDWPSISRDLGRFLAVLHLQREDEPIGIPGGPDACLRINAWLRGLSPDFYGAHFSPVVREAIGDSVWSTLSTWCQSLLAETDTTTCHGQFGMGAIHVHEDDSALEVLAGPALCIAHPSFDIGYYLGELLEMSRSDKLPADQFQLSIQAFEDGYGRALTVQDFRAAILRILMHQHDYVAYSSHQVSPEVHENLRFVRYLVESGMGTR